jgi:hypothetical protein
LHLGLSHFAACLEEVSSVVLGELGVAVPSCSAVPFPAPAAAAASVSPAPSALVALFDLVRNAPAPSSGAVLSAAPPASSSPSLLSPQ